MLSVTVAVAVSPPGQGATVELILPATEDLVVVTEVGQTVEGGASVLARYRS